MRLIDFPARCSSAIRRRLRLRDRRSRDALALGPGPGHAGAHPLTDQRALELGEARHHTEHQLALRGRGVDVLLVADEVDAERPELHERVDERLGRAGEAVVAPDQDDVDRALAHGLHEALELRPVVVGARGEVDELDGDLKAAARGVLAELAQLGLGILAAIVGRDPGVKGSAPGGGLGAADRLTSRLGHWSGWLSKRACRFPGPRGLGNPAHYSAVHAYRKGVPFMIDRSHRPARRLQIKHGNFLRLQRCMCRTGPPLQPTSSGRRPNFSAARSAQRNPGTRSRRRLDISCSTP